MSQEYLDSTHGSSKEWIHIYRSKAVTAQFRISKGHKRRGDKETLIEGAVSKPISRRQTKLPKLEKQREERETSYAFVSLKEVKSQLQYRLK